MNKLKILSIVLVATTALSNAQDLEPAKKAIDAEKLENAKVMLKAIIQAKPSLGKANFLLGTIYLKQNIEDSAKMFFDKGLIASESARYNNYGLAQIEFEEGNATAGKARLEGILKDLKKKDLEEYVYMARAYMNSSKPDFKSAIAILLKAKEINSTDPQVQLALGDAYYGDKNQNDAYAAYRNAFTTDNSLLRAKMQLGVLLKGANAFDDAVKEFNEVISINPNYGPVYRELAETYNKWSYIKPSRREELTPKALSNYEKYLSLTDYSLTSRMRHADFLILSKDYKALEVEANAMQKLDKVNPRILRYLGYSAYENGNNDAAITALNDFTKQSTNKIIARDYLYLGQAKLKKSIADDGKTIDPILQTEAIANIKKAVEMEPLMANELNELGKKYFTLKLYPLAASIFEIAISNITSLNALEDNVYYGLTVYSANRNLDADKIDKIQIANADKALDNAIVLKPDYQESYLYKARLNNLINNDPVMATNYQKYLDIVVPKGDEEIMKSKVKVLESYNNIGAFYANTDKVKAKEFFSKSIALDPTNEYATKSLSQLK